MMDGLLGKKLGHSFSPAVHKAFGNTAYRLFETDDPVGFLSSQPFRALNVTTPYKETVLPVLEKLDDIALRTQSVNLILRENERLVGYNTDYYGLAALLRREGVSLSGKKVLILGNGGAAKTVFVLAKDQGACAITKMVRRIKENEEILFSEIDKVADYDIIINTTSAGMFPDNESKPPLPLDRFHKVRLLVDLIYNPLCTALMAQAKALGIPACNGLYMLIAQAKKSHELAGGNPVSDSFMEKIYRSLRKKALNIVFVGLPLSGKTLYMRKMAEMYHKTPVDTDQMIESESQTPISEIFRDHGEPFFRTLESAVIDRIYQLGNQIISTGGGMIENPEIMAKLKQNGVILFLDKDPQKIMQHDIHNRPLIQSPTDVLKLDARRRPLYEKYSDIVINVDKPKGEVVEEIEAKLNEYLSH
jgi:shikimate dehydrogenase